MANSSAKRIVIQNSKKIKILLAVIIIAHLIFLGLTVLKPILQARSFEATAPTEEGDLDADADVPEPPKILFLDEDVPKKVKFGYISNSLSILFCFWRLYSMSRPVYSATEPGEIQDPGVDLSTPGALHQYYFDIIYISIFVMIMTVTVSSKFWYAHILTVCFALYKVWTSVIKPVMNIVGAAGGQNGMEKEMGGYLPTGKNGRSRLAEKREKEREEKEKEKEGDGLNRAQRRQKMKEEKKKRK